MSSEQFYRECDPCLCSDIKVNAESYCAVCDEYYCQACMEYHKIQTYTVNHQVKSLSTEVIFCSTCKSFNKETAANSFCLDCKTSKPLCESCARKHVKMKSTRGHRFSDKINCIHNRISFITTRLEKRHRENEIPFMQGSDGVGQALARGSVKFYRECDPCLCGDIKVNAESYCEVCDEYYCKACREYHKAQTQTMNHQVNRLSTEVIICTTCKSLNKETAANSYCVDCKQTEPLCESCARKHLKMKSTRGHRLSDNISCILKRINQTLPNEQEFKVQPMQQATNMSEATYASIEEPNEILGQPYCTESKSSSILLQWQSEYKLNETEIYQIMYKDYPNGKWTIFTNSKSCKSTSVEVDGLKSDTSYVFKVRIINDSSGQEGLFTKNSEIVKTRQSPALSILKTAQLIERGPPEVYRLPIKENVSGRNESAKTRKFFLGRDSNEITEKTIMIVGATGSGKRTLINGMANYIMGVNFEDPFRFSLINLETCDKELEHAQARSETEWVNCYSLHNNISDRVNYSVNLIDTPNDTGRVENVKNIINQIHELFTVTGEKGIQTLDAVCFVLKAPDVELTATQKYFFETILSVFGNDLKDNICTLITFADCQRPPVLSRINSLKGISLPYETYFAFNNSALYVDNTTNVSNNFSPFFWEMSSKSYHTFFDHINKMETKNLFLTSEVLRERHKVENILKNLAQEIQVGLSKINVFEKEVNLFNKSSEAILANQNFEYYVEEHFQEKIDYTGTGWYSLTCLNCNYTCLEKCTSPNDDSKAKCSAMNSEGMCTKCPKRCHWHMHLSTPYYLIWKKRQVKKFYDDMKRKYEEATKCNGEQKQALTEIIQDITRQEQAIQVKLVLIAKLNNRINEIALRPDPISIVQNIDVMIDCEKRENKIGFEKRIDALKKCKQQLMSGKYIKIFKDCLSNTRIKISAADNEILNENSIF